ncbi:MAG TPA: lysylphosphatidylglycerol synthase domain-containing protein [Solirubrobacterales bacterium]|nr:lysylphosphatidylglycerol synthase domain-containing protein [Solirubrobacterales bacterium]
MESRMPEPLPRELGVGGMVRRVAGLGLLILVVALLISTLPGLGEVRERFADAQPLWLLAMAVLELASCLAYVVAFRGVFCTRLDWRFSYEIAMAEQGTNVLVPAGGVGGLALGAWALRQGGMSTGRIARRSVAFFVLTSIPNFVCAAVLGCALGAGLLPGGGPALLSAILGGLALAAIVLVALLPRILGRVGPDRRDPGEEGRAARAARLARAVAVTIADGVQDAAGLLRARQPYVILGAIGYMALDVAALAAAFAAFGTTPPFAAFVFGYVIGQLGGLIPLPGGIGGIDGGLIGSLTLYGSPLAQVTAAVLAYRVLQLGIPAILGSIAFLQLRRTLSREEAPAALCEPFDEKLPVLTVPSR